MNVLIVYAHPEPQSFNGAMKDAAINALTQAGHQVKLSDLYAMAFNPVADPAQFQVRANPMFFSLLKEQSHASKTNSVAADVAAEHEKLFWAQLLIFQFPLWWGSMPAIMKGWIDRVFSAGLVYGRGISGLQGRKALLSVTTSARENGEESGRQLKAELTHVTGNMLALPNLEVLEPFFAFGPGDMSEEERLLCLRTYSNRVLAATVES